MSRKKNMDRLNIPIMLLVLSCSVLVSKYTNTTNNHNKWECNMLVEQVNNSTEQTTVVLASK